MRKGEKEGMEWFTKADFGRYGHGNYVAIVGKKVVSSGRDPKVAFNKARKAHPNKEVILWKVPKKDMMVL